MKLCSFVHSLLHSFWYTNFIRSFMHVFMRSCIHAFIANLFIHGCMNAWMCMGAQRVGRSLRLSAQWEEARRLPRGARAPRRTKIAPRPEMLLIFADRFHKLPFHGTAFKSIAEDPCIFLFSPFFSFLETTSPAHYPEIIIWKFLKEVLRNWAK